MSTPKYDNLLDDLVQHTHDNDDLTGGYVQKTGDTMTGPLVIDPITGYTALEARKDIYILPGQRLVFHKSNP